MLHFFRKKFLVYYLASAILLLISGLQLNTSIAQPGRDGSVYTQAQIMPGIALELTGGVNQRGKRTLLQNGMIDFGNVSFVNPDFISNGDAFFRQKELWLEAVIEAKVTYNGASAVDLNLSSIKSGGNEFSRIMYSSGMRQTDETVTIPIQPDSQLLGTIRNSGDSIKLRLIGVVLPTQTGLLVARVQVEADKK